MLLNQEVRKNGRTHMGMEILFGNKKYFFTPEREQILDLLISSYETAVQKNLELIRTQEELRALHLSIRAANLAAIIEVVVESLRPTAQAKAIQIRTLLDPAIDLVSGDSSRLQQVVWNLLSNALKFTPNNGLVEVRLEHRDGFIQMSVAETGMGISAEFLPRVFDRFRQADSSSTRVCGGVGLGLAIVCHLVELHGGFVAAQSPGEGQGATFTVKLRPWVDRSLPPAVDDAAPEVLGQWRPDILLSDIGMSNGDGYELIRKVRKLNPDQGGKIPAVALTAYAREEDRIRALLAGFQMHVVKPVNPDELLAVMASLTGRTGRD